MLGGLATTSTSLATDGYSVAAEKLTAEACDSLLSALPATTSGRGGVRNLLSNEAVQSFVRSEAVSSIVRPIAGTDACAVRATLFDKTPTTNWKVAWHQDRSGALASRVDHPGFAHWRLREGLHHADLPQTVVEQMVALRLHLDDCSAGHGPLRVLPGSHLLGKLNEPRIAKITSSLQGVTLPLARGCILVMRPLLLHASSAAEIPVHRRVLHIEFATQEAIAPAKWAESIAIGRWPCG